MNKYKIVRVENPYCYYYEIFERLFGFLWWRKWKDFKTETHVEAEKAIIQKEIKYTYNERRN